MSTITNGIAPLNGSRRQGYSILLKEIIEHPILQEKIPPIVMDASTNDLYNAKNIMKVSK